MNHQVGRYFASLFCRQLYALLVYGSDTKNKAKKENEKKEENNLEKLILYSSSSALTLKCSGILDGYFFHGSHVR